jgi:hypothetical protein
MAELTLQSSVVVVTLRGSVGRGGALKDPAFTTIGGRTFLSGVSVSGPSNWTYGQRMHFACDEIIQMVEFESEEAHGASRRGDFKKRGLLRRMFPGA